jgi:hypothetical protein
VPYLEGLGLTRSTGVVDLSVFVHSERRRFSGDILEVTVALGDANLAKAGALVNVTVDVD